MTIDYKGVVIEVIKSDITTLAVDAIVNAANHKLTGGGGVDGAIHRIGGSELTAACLRLGGCKTGEAKITLGYKLPARFVIHTVGPIYGQHDGYEASFLEDCYKNTLALAGQKNIISLAFPSISTGVYGYPLWESVPLALESVKEFIDEHPGSSIKRIIFALFSEEDLEMYVDTLEEVFY